MSNTGNEYEQPGINYPDREDIDGVEPDEGEPMRDDDATQRPAGADADHHGQDGGRDTLTASEAQHTGGLGSGETQDLPAMSQNNATAEEKIAGIVMQSRQDVATGTREPVEDMLRQRLDDAGIEVSDEFVAQLADRVRAG
jgi:hypothetical protein